MVMFLYGFLGHGVEFFPEVEPNKAYIDGRAPSGTNLETSNALVQKVEKMLEKVPTSKPTLPMLGVGGGNQFAAGDNVSHASRITIDFVDEADRVETSFETIEHIRTSLKTLTGADFEIDQERDGPPVGAPVNVEISGEDIQILGDLAAKPNASLHKYQVP